MKTGLTADTKDRMIFGAGEVFANYDEYTAEGTSLGVTRGESEVNLNQEERNTQFNGVLGPVKGLVWKNKVAPTLTVRLLEVTAENLMRAIAGAVQDEDGNIIGGDIGDESYLTNIALVAEGSEGSDFIVILYNVLATSMSPIRFPDKAEAVLEVVFSAHYDPATPDEDPWKIIPVPAVGS